MVAEVYVSATTMRTKSSHDSEPDRNPDEDVDRYHSAL